MSGFVTATNTSPTPCAGASHVICASLSTVTFVAAVPSNVTPASASASPPDAIVRWNPVPVIVTVVPPACAPLSGVTPVTDGGTA